MSEMTTMGKTARIEVHKKLQFLTEPHPYKVLYGGRMGLKSWGIARQLLIDATLKPIRTLCCRETMLSMDDSVHQLLSDQIQLLGLEGHFDVQRSGIKGINGSEFAYAGLRHNARLIKSYEGFDRAWVEEAAQVSKASWEILLPTIRKEGSEIWVSFNPELESDYTYRYWITNPPPGAVVVQTGWEDNIWLTETARQKIEHMRATAPEDYEHVYGGACIQTIEGAVYARELRAVEIGQRITSVPYNPQQPVLTFWDLGFGDQTAIWFVQPEPFQYRVIDYLEDSGRSLNDYLQELQARHYVYGTAYLPHDAKAHDLRTGRSIEEMMRSAGWNVQIVPKLSIIDGINAARMIMSLCWFDGQKTADGLHALRHYRWKPLGAGGEVKREPVHDWASNGADAFRTMALGVKPQKPAPEPQHQGIYPPYFYESYQGQWS